MRAPSSARCTDVRLYTICIKIGTNQRALALLNSPQALHITNKQRAPASARMVELASVFFIITESIGQIKWHLVLLRIVILNLNLKNTSKRPILAFPRRRWSALFSHF